jgi:hypothetical protein
MSTTVIPKQSPFQLVTPLERPELKKTSDQLKIKNDVIEAAAANTEAAVGRFPVLQHPVSIMHQ